MVGRYRAGWVLGVALVAVGVGGAVGCSGEPASESSAAESDSAWLRSQTTLDGAPGTTAPVSHLSETEQRFVDAARVGGVELGDGELLYLGYSYCDAAGRAVEGAPPSRDADSAELAVDAPEAVKVAADGGLCPQ